MESRAFIIGLIVGILATVTMDAVAVFALRLGTADRGPRRTGPDLIGRSVGLMPKPLRVQCVARYKLTNRRPARRNLPSSWGLQNA